MSESVPKLYMKKRDRSDSDGIQRGPDNTEDGLSVLKNDRREVRLEVPFFSIIVKDRHIFFSWSLKNN